jgi:hypothetical protein
MDKKEFVMEPCTDSEPITPRVPPPLGTGVLRLVFLLITITLIGCSSSLQPVSGNHQPCLPAQDRPSCFYSKGLEQKNTKLVIFVHGVFGRAATTFMIYEA